MLRGCWGHGGETEQARCMAMEERAEAEGMRQGGEEAGG